MAARMKRNNEEDREQIVLAEWLDLMSILYCAVPNGGSRNKAEAAKLKRMGVKRGVPDVLVFDHPRHTVGSGYSRGVAIELKKPDGGVVSKFQEAWLRELEDRGWAVHVAHGAQDAIEWLQSMGYGRRR